MAKEDTSGIGIDDEGRAFGGVEEHAISGFGADSGDCQKPLPNSVKFSGKEKVEGTLIFFNEDLQKGTEASGFDSEIAGWPDPFGQGFFRNLPQGKRGKGLFFFETLDGAFDVFPVGVLGEDGADTNFKRGISRPPTLMAEGLQ